MDAADPPHVTTVSLGKGREGEVWIRKFFHLLPDFPVIRKSITKSNCRPRVGAGAAGPGSAFGTSAGGDFLCR